MKTPSYKPLYILVYVVISVSIIGLMITPFNNWWEKLLGTIILILLGAGLICFLKFGRWAQEKFYDKFTKKRN
ncbi:hypothetical protein ACTFRO_21450 [Bacillus cereus group sp. MYBK163-2]|uniref:hypothetical protein n=1 Tax=Bacillus cereus group TaxID=86661 RepID=UPI000BC00BA4|nr:hypothetical protein [Bacillus cereus]MRB23453.1 hypothetical protein [Bacillus thuringiensis]ASZ64717.1 hypothetical protein CJ306_04925 [Bacillus cereus]MCU5532412.1 hypothetical protein [Bacillus cereus]MDA1525303.1 hypothetical protein [Bacillus cereus]MDA1611163.1 hypothetical protein [Bacillus cereus]